MKQAEESKAAAEKMQRDADELKKKIIQLQQRLDRRHIK